MSTSLCSACARTWLSSAAEPLLLVHGGNGVGALWLPLITRLAGWRITPQGGDQAYDVAPDGRFLVIRNEAASAPPKLELIQNWFDELKRLAPTR